MVERPLDTLDALALGLLPARKYTGREIGPIGLLVKLHLLATLGAQKAVTLAGTPVPAMDMATLNLLVRAIGTAPAAV